MNTLDSKPNQYTEQNLQNEKSPFAYNELNDLNQNKQFRQKSYSNSQSRQSEVYQVDLTKIIQCPGLQKKYNCKINLGIIICFVLLIVLLLFSTSKKFQKDKINLNKSNKINLNKLQKKDKADFILQQRSKISRKFGQKFQDVIYTVSGTNIKQQQFDKAKERMNIWKYINPKTKKIEFLDQVNYQEQKSSPNMESTLAKIEKIILQQKQQYQKKYDVGKYMEIPFCVVIPSYKNVDRCIRNLNSILVQDYQAYHIIYIDDASKDGTAQKIKQYIKKYQIPQSKLLFIQNNVTQRALPNINYAARNLCNSGEIMTIIDGDDYLIGAQVFKVVNSRYQSKNLLSLYTNNIRDHLPYYLKISYSRDYPQKIKQKQSFRQHYFIISHLRTFYVDLYWKIKERDLKDYTGKFFTASNDVAILMPIIQMSAQRYQYLPQLTYAYDAATGYNNFYTKKRIQARNARITRRRPKYPKLVGEQQFEKILKKKIKQFESTKLTGKQRKSNKNK